MKVAVTGAAGFLGWHTRCALFARGDTAVAIDRQHWADPDALVAALDGVDAVLHLAGANRAEPEELREGNAGLASTLTDALDAAGVRPAFVYANSIQAGNGGPFGDGKLRAAEHLRVWGERTGAAVADVRLPNLFGEHGRPHYNSVVATFCHELASGGTPEIHQDREIPLLHAQDAVARMLDCADHETSGVVTFDAEARPMSVTALLELLAGFRDRYATGDIPPLVDPLHLALFNTYRSFTFPEHAPIHPPLHADERGELFECVRAWGGQAQVFCSTTRPGFTRGEHFHLRKVERFLVISGTAQIALRKLFTEDVVTFDVGGDRSAIVDMPTMWAHSITNIGTDDLITMFWAHEILDQEHPDTFREPVRAGAVATR